MKIDIEKFSLLFCCVFELRQINFDAVVDGYKNDLMRGIRFNVN